VTGPADDVSTVLVTRFAVSWHGEQPGWEAPGWLRHRLRLFRRYTVPSVRRQRHPVDQWLVALDTRVPDSWRESVSVACAGLPLVLLDVAPVQRIEAWIELVDASIARSRPFVLSARLDSDDALAASYFTRLLDAVDPDRPGFWNIPSGWQLLGRRLFAIRDPSNPFVARLEPADGLVQTSSSLPHDRVSESGSLHQVEGPGGWLQVLHDRNIRNAAAVAGRRVRWSPGIPVRPWMLLANPIGGPHSRINAR